MNGLELPRGHLDKGRTGQSEAALAVLATSDHQAWWSDAAGTPGARQAAN
jgi:hypothetical protein